MNISDAFLQEFIDHFKEVPFDNEEAQKEIVKAFQSVVA